MISEVFNADCMVGMAEYPDKHFDLAVVDPPYGIRQDGRNNHTRSKLCKAKDYRGNSRYDSATPDSGYFKELIRISKHQIVFGANHFISKMPIDSPCWIIWDKNNGDNDFADCEMAWTSFDSAVRKYKFTWNGMLQEDMKNKEIRIHPNHKPVALYRWIFQNYLPEGGKVIDTHLGSGSSRIAADMAGNIDFTGFELDEQYYSDQEKRFKKYKQQQVIQFPLI